MNFFIVLNSDLGMICLILYEFLRCSGRSDLAFIKQCHGRSMFLGLDKIMSGHKNGSTIRNCLIEQIPDRQTSMRVEARCWLVKNDQTGATEKGQCEHQPAFLTA